MKWIVTVLTLVVSSYAFAGDECPNLNGVYDINGFSVIRVTQNECKSLSTTLGISQGTGKIDWYNGTTEKTLINGPELCGKSGCITATSSDTELELSTDKEWTQDNEEHGVCNYNRVKYSINEENNLVAKHMVYNCEDSFIGQVILVHRRIH